MLIYPFPVKNLTFAQKDNICAGITEAFPSCCQAIAKSDVGLMELEGKRLDKWYL